MPCKEFYNTIITVIVFVAITLVLFGDWNYHERFAGEKGMDLSSDEYIPISSDEYIPISSNVIEKKYTTEETYPIYDPMNGVEYIDNYNEKMATVDDLYVTDKKDCDATREFRNTEVAKMAEKYKDDFYDNAIRPQYNGLMYRMINQSAPLLLPEFEYKRF